LDVVEFLTRTGLRIGELAALKDADVNFMARKLTVNKTLVSHELKVEEFEINAPKTNTSYRIIDLDNRSVEIRRRRIQYNRNRIEDVRKRDNGELYQEYLMKTGRNVGKVLRKKVKPRNNFVETDYIFQLQTGNPVNDSEFNRFINERRYSKTRCVREMLQEHFPDWNKHISSHTFRYTHISYLAEQGVPIKAIMRRVGHKNSKTTLEIYNQVTEQMNRYLIDTLNGVQFDQLEKSVNTRE
jgi:integrase